MKVAMNKMLILNYYLFGILPDDSRAFKDYYKLWLNWLLW